jgi:selenocysteine lyase/cysteine desulfurase
MLAVVRLWGVLLTRKNAYLQSIHLLTVSRMTAYLSKTNVQLGASYHTGTQSNTKYEEGYQAAARYVNADRDEIGTWDSSSNQRHLTTSQSSELQPPSFS